MKRNKTWLAWALAVGLIAYLLGAATASRSTVTEGEVVVGYASGTALHADAIQAPGGTPRIADVEVAFSAANADSEGFAPESRLTENSVMVQPDPTDFDPETPFEGKNASARGAPIEFDLNTAVPVPPGTPVLARSGSLAPPDADPVVNEVGPVPGGPVIYAALLHSDAITRWDASTCLTSAQLPIAYGRGYAADAQLVSAAGSANEDGTLQNPVVASDDPGPPRAVSQTNSFVYAVPNGDPDHYGLVSEVHQTYAPVTVARTTDEATGANDAFLIVEVLGEWYVRALADGVNPTTITYGVTDPATGEPMAPGATVIRFSTDGGATYTTRSLQDLGEEGTEIPLGPAGSIMLGEDLRALSAPGALADPLSTPTTSEDGTLVSGAVDVVRVNIGDNPESGFSLADLRIGHFETELTVPEGGFTCGAAETTTTTDDSTTSTSTSSTTSSTSSTSTSTTAAPTTTTAPPPPTTQAPAPPPPAPPATPIRIQPRTVG